MGCRGEKSRLAARLAWSTLSYACVRSISPSAKACPPALAASASNAEWAAAEGAALPADPPHIHGRSFAWASMQGASAAF